ncbi:hypothetical protein [Actinospica sp.]|jgi:hypothetical protein|uniref:hypothetical protein n=1 Tax=Actinospica sp. TaxID=1872142 RepID=UPI002C59B5DD|nr:hypothetical protein [Actinospica sp.]HWG28656.1 hypothetical protein [Actinospica sp.]
MNVRRIAVVVVVRRVGLLILIVCCLVVPVVSILTNAFSAPDKGSMQNYCPDPTTPCELPPVIPTGHP